MSFRMLLKQEWHSRHGARRLLCLRRATPTRTSCVDGSGSEFRIAVAESKLRAGEIWAGKFTSTETLLIERFVDARSRTSPLIHSVLFTLSLNSSPNENFR